MKRNLRQEIHVYESGEINSQGIRSLKSAQSNIQVLKQTQKR
ncbi:hypothetical protein BSM4216_2273 [Bacillus smithii]|nr:hypothetical protein BSM4216_2273 [Bacillus smithii]